MNFYEGYARNKKYEIEEAGNPKILERCLIFMGNYMQTIPGGSIFEYVRIETKFFDDKMESPESFQDLKVGRE